MPKLFFKKVSLYLIYRYLYNMGRKSIPKEQRKVKFGISLDVELFDRMVKERIKKSTLLNKLLKEYYGNKDMQ